MLRMLYEDLSFESNEIICPLYSAEIHVLFPPTSSHGLCVCHRGSDHLFLLLITEKNDAVEGLPGMSRIEDE
jgi:hypothetical protein